MTNLPWPMPLLRSAAPALDAALGVTTPVDPVPSGREVLARVATATGEWQLQRREGHFELICNGVFLMASYNRESDRMLATLALDRVAGDGLRVLVGGLGIGFTAQAALESSRVATLEVAEVEPVVVDWHRTYFAPLCDRPLDDRRTHLLAVDLFEVSLGAASYDAILLDTDNGPDWLARPINARLYHPETVSRFVQALTPRGVLAVWSASTAPDFARILSKAATRVEVVETADDVTRDRTHPAWIYLANPQ